MPLPTRLLLSAEEAADYCGVSVKTFRAHVRVAPVRIGSLVKYDRRAIDRWVASQDRSVPLTGDDWLGLLDEAGEGVRA